MQSSLRKLSIGGFSNVFGGDDPHAAVTQVSERVAEMAEMLARRVSSEIDSLPFTECVPLSKTHFTPYVLHELCVYLAMCQMVYAP